MKIRALLSFRYAVLWLSILLTVGCLFLVRYAVSEISRSEAENINSVPEDLLEPDNAPEPPEELPDFFWDNEESAPAEVGNGKQLT
jgi:hypothetical protein